MGGQAGQGEEEKLPRLPSGPHDLPRELVSADQRARLIDAFSRVVAAKGFEATTIADITRRASVSRNVFYELFGGKEGCFIAAYDLVRADLTQRMGAAAAPYEEWPEQLCASLRELLRYFAADPDLARLCLIEPMGAGPEVRAHHEAALEELVSRLQQLAHRSTAGGGEEADEMLFHGAILLITQRINLGQAARLEELLPELAQALLRPDLDAAQIAAVLARIEAGP